MKTFLAFLLATVAVLLSAAEYELILLGDLHFDAPEYRAGAAVQPFQQKEAARNAGIWKKNVPELLAAAGSKVSPNTKYVIQLGDVIQGDSVSDAEHVKMLNDVLAALRPYFGGVPLLFAEGNHDVRSLDMTTGRTAAYNSFMLPCLKKELKLDKAPEDLNYAVRNGGDLLLFLDSVHPDLSRIEALIAQNAGFKRLLVFTHIPVLPCPGAGVTFQHTPGGVGLAKGVNNQPENRKKLLELLAKHNAYIFCGHTHTPAIVEWKSEQGRIVQLTCSSMAQRGGAPAFKLRSAGRTALEEALPEEKFPGFCKEYAEPARFFELFPGWGFVVLRLSDDAVVADLYSGNGRTPEKSVVLSKPMPEKLFTEPEAPKKR